MQTEIEALRAQLASLTSKEAQAAQPLQATQVPSTMDKLPRTFYGLPRDAMVGECLKVAVTQPGLAAEFSSSFCPSYFAFQQASVAPRVATTRRVVQTDGLASGTGHVTRSRGAHAVIPKSFMPLTPAQESTFLARGEDMTSTAQQGADTTTNSRIFGIPTDQEEAQQAPEVVSQWQVLLSGVTHKLLTAPFFSFQDLQMNAQDVIQLLDGDTCVSSSAVIEKGKEHQSVIDMLMGSKVVDSHSLHMVAHTSPKVPPKERLVVTTGVAIADNSTAAIKVEGHIPNVVLLDTGA
jgi:hypothetical protein